MCLWGAGQLLLPILVFIWFLDNMFHRGLIYPKHSRYWLFSNPWRCGTGWQRCCVSLWRCLGPGDRSEQGQPHVCGPPTPFGARRQKWTGAATHPRDGCSPSATSSLCPGPALREGPGTRFCVWNSPLGLQQFSWVRLCEPCSRKPQKRKQRTSRGRGWRKAGESSGPRGVPPHPLTAVSALQRLC